MAEKDEAPTPTDDEAKPSKEGKPKGGKKKEKEEKPKQRPTTKDESADFRYIVRIANTDLNGKDRVETALAHVRGLGIRTAAIVAERVGVNRTEKIGNLNDQQIQQIEQQVQALADTIPDWMANRSHDVETGNTLHVFGVELETLLRDDLNRLKKIRSYRGVRHETGQKVRGQRTRANGRTGLTVGVQRKAILQKQAAAKKEGGEKEKK